MNGSASCVNKHTWEVTVRPSNCPECAEMWCSAAEREPETEKRETK